MQRLHPELRQLIESGPLAHVSTIGADGSPHVTVVWLGLDGDDLLTAHMHRGNRKLGNVERDPRVTVSFEAPHEPGVFLAPYAVIRARAAIEGPTEAAWDLLNRLAKVYVAPDAPFPAPRRPGYLIRYTVERVGGVGPWATRQR
jgi:PPOX class probable F420-dependent enzyme